MRTDLFVKHLTIRLPRISEAKKNVRIFSGMIYRIQKETVHYYLQKEFLSSISARSVLSRIFTAPVFIP